MTKPKPWWKQAQDTAVPGAAGAATAADDAAAAPIAAGPRELADGETTTMAGSGAQPYVLRNVGGVYSCSCPAWRNQGAAIERRTCKHLRALRGDDAEQARVGPLAGAPTTRTRPSTAAASGASVGAIAAAVAPPVLLAHAWDHATDLTGWWMSEKLDGVRAYWNGAQFMSRLGNPFIAPPWFVAGLPARPLDGELWAGRKQFQRAVSIARRQDAGDAWRELTYVVFDAPDVDGPFEDRLAFVRALVEEHQPPHARWHPHHRCAGLDHLRAELARIEALGGEGLMMREPGSRYQVGRSWSLRKVKTFHDAEARVIAHVRGAGKHAARLGALQCALPDGTVFNVGTGLTDHERTHPPPVGAIITYRYQELSTDGVPRFPSYVGVRDDVAWPPDGARPQAATDARVAPTTATATATGAAVTDEPPAFADADRPRRTFARGDARWSVELDGRAVTVTDHAADGTVDTTTRRSASAPAAWRDADRLIAARLADGYAEIL
ncbi:MAG: DNA ligase [Kofleriaceae bacterium]